VVESLRDSIGRGLLRQTKGTCAIAEIIRDQPFPDDLINIEFETIPGGTTYFLSCETYHSSGGVFKKGIL
jgi:hypothetical protein